PQTQLFSVGQFCDGDLEVAFRSNTCYVWNLEGDDLLTGSRKSNLYTIPISDLTWVYFLRTKDDAQDMIINLINQVQRTLKAQISKIRIDNGTEFKNEKLRSFYAKLDIVHHTSTARTPQQNSVVERRNHTLVEAARTMLIFSKTLEFLWAEAIATACFTQERTPPCTYSIPIDSYLANIGIFIGYSESSRGFRIYNRRTKKIMETIHVKFDELTTMASECNNSDSDTPQIVTSSEEPITQESLTPVLEIHFDEQIQKHVAELDGNTIMHSFELLELKEAESSLNYQDPLNMHDLQELYNIPDGCEDCIPELLLKKHGMEKCDDITTLMATARIDEDLQGTSTDQTKYRSMIGVLCISLQVDQILPLQHLSVHDIRHAQPKNTSKRSKGSFDWERELIFINKKL
ncbi:retrovirus-related pol polyprotein from transposon TNT 1-94, partial [Tanacetum coccineum]